MAEAMEVLPWVFVAFLSGVILTLFIQSQAAAPAIASSPLVSTAALPSSLIVQRDELGRIIGIQGVA